MKLPIRITILLFSVMTLFLTACQNEVIEETPQNQGEVIVPNSNLTNTMRNASANNGSVDNILDNSNCFTVNLPVTVEVNDLTITIETLEDLILIEAIYDANGIGNDDLDFLFPITITLNDYTEVVVESEDQLEDYMDICMGDDDVIECANFVYPISFSIYNSDFQVLETVVINNDYQLYLFLENLDDNDDDMELVSLNFPVSITYLNGETIEVFNNQELENAIDTAEQFCDDDCSEAYILEHLKECFWEIESYNDNDYSMGYSLYFNDNNSLQVMTENFDFIEANWQLSSTGSGAFKLVISNFIEDINGTWIFDDCDEDEFEFVQIIPNSNTYNTMELEQNCSADANPFNCFEDVSVSVCDDNNDGIATFNLETLVVEPVMCTAYFVSSFHLTMADAEININAIAQPESYTNTTNPQTVFLRIETLNGMFQVFEIELEVEDCSSTCSADDVEGMLLDCEWTLTSFAGSDFSMFNIDFDSDNEAEIFMPNGNEEYTATWTVSQQANDVEVTISNVSGGNVQIIEGTYKVVECVSNQLILHDVNNSNNELVLDKDCG
ncbi:hypothetical protein OS188_12060 [Xanthomarina sp. F1114]|uniref:hypothetical protein n=1 Tax=Xanthomarina sp. F1114 TaxID=2996019 RepID=UPI00225E293A|nr:hypothetical protein [Xanthomarina sp. F1114]MCX7548687.1 hypothetical protein [Xanthomarina sp. F1114]